MGKYIIETDLDNDGARRKQLAFILRMKEREAVIEQRKTDASICPRCHMTRSTYEIQNGICYSCGD